MNIKSAIFVLFAFIMFPYSPSYGETTSPYEPEEFEIINNSLDKLVPKEPTNWRQHTKVKDIFKGKAYQPPEDYKPDASEFDRVPDGFKNEAAAKQAGAKCEYIKSAKYKTCLLLIVKYSGDYEDNGAGLVIYDSDGGIPYHKTQTICLPSHNAYAKIDFVDLFNLRKKFIRIEYLNFSQMGQSNDVHLIIGWRNEAFQIVFWEDVFLKMFGAGDYYLENMQYTIHKGRKPFISLKSYIDKDHVHAQPYDFHAYWRDWLFWNDDSFSFYNRNQENLKVDYSRGLSCNRVSEGTGRKNILNRPPIPNTLSCTPAMAREYFNNSSKYEKESCEKNDSEMHRKEP